MLKFKDSFVCTVKYQSSEFGSHELAFLVFLVSFMSVLAGANCPSESPNPLQLLIDIDFISKVPL